MANEEHLIQLMKGTTNWNLWRKENWSVKPDLSEASLSGFDLPGIFLSQADLRRVNFSGANLSGANINQAILDEAIFDGANLYRAGLSGINLQSTVFGNANLEEAVLSCSNLINVDLSRVNLRRANLQGAKLNRANLSGVDLSNSNLSSAKLNSTHLNRAILLAANLYKADLREADLRGANLKHSDLSGAFLHKTQIDKATYLEQKWSFVWALVNQVAEVKDLCGSDLRGVNLSGSDLSYFNLSEANLSEANLSEVNFRGTNLSKANLYSADLRGASLLEADLREANLRSAQLSNTNFSGWDIGGNLVRIDLKAADLSRACLFEANLFRAKLFRVNLREADLRQAYLAEADLVGTDLSKACLEQANLTRAQAVGANFTEARLTGACLEDWSINQETKLDGILCDYVYKKSSQQERRPSSGSFKPGEFTALFQKALETVDLIFADGIDWKAFFTSFQELRTKHGDDNISIQAIEKKSGGAFVIRLEVSADVDKVAIEQQAKQLYEGKIQQLEERVSEYRDEVGFLRRLLQSNTNIERIVEKMAENQSPKYDLRGSSIGTFVDTAQAGSKQSSVQYINMSQDLTQADQQIQDLIEQRQKQGMTVDVAQEQVSREMTTEAKKEPAMKDKLVMWGQSLGSATVSDVVKGAVKLAIRSAGIPLP